MFFRKNKRCVCVVCNLDIVMNCQSIVRDQNIAMLLEYFNVPVLRDDPVIKGSGSFLPVSQASGASES